MWIGSDENNVFQTSKVLLQRHVWIFSKPFGVANVSDFGMLTKQLGLDYTSKVALITL